MKLLLKILLLLALGPILLVAAAAVALFTIDTGLEERGDVADVVRGLLTG